MQGLAGPVRLRGRSPVPTHLISKPNALPVNTGHTRTGQNGVGLFGPTQRMHVCGQSQQIGNAAANALPAMPHGPCREQQHQSDRDEKPREEAHAEASGDTLSVPAVRWMPNFFM